MPSPSLIYGLFKFIYEIYKTLYTYNTTDRGIYIDPVYLWGGREEGRDGGRKEGRK